MTPAATRDLIDRLCRARNKVALLVVADPVYAPIFTRLEAEIADLEAMQSGDVIARARACARQRATA